MQHSTRTVEDMCHISPGGHAGGVRVFCTAKKPREPAPTRGALRHSSKLPRYYAAAATGSVAGAMLAADVETIPPRATPGFDVTRRAPFQPASSVGLEAS